MSGIAAVASPDAQNLYLGRGAFYFDRFLAGTTTPTGERHVGNVSKIELVTTDDVKEAYQNMTSSAGLYATVNARRKVELKVTGDEYSLENIALILMGDTGKLAQTGSSVTDETVTASAKQGRYYATDYRKISAVTVKGGVSGATAKVLNTDYTVDAVSGRIYVVPGGGIADGDIIKVSYTYATISLDVVKAGTQSKIAGYVRFVGDPAAGPTYELECWNAQFNPDGPLALIQDDYGNWSLSARLVADLTNHSDAPWFRMINVV